MRKSHMTPAELKAAIIKIYGTAYGSGRKYAKDIGKSEITVSRQLNGAGPVSATQAKLTRELMAGRKPLRREIGKSKMADFLL